MRLGRPLFRSFMGLLVVMVAAACSGNGKSAPGAAVPQENAITREVRRGPFCVRLLVDKDTLSIADTLRLTIEAEAEEGFEAELPGFGDKLGEFGIRDYRHDPPRLTPEKKLIVRKTYLLEPFLSGDYRLAPMPVRFRKQAEPAGPGDNSTKRGDPWPHQIETDELTIKVTSLLAKDHQEMALNPMRGPVPLPPGPIPVRTLLIGLAGVALAIGGLLLIWRRYRSTDPHQAAPALPAHDLAYRQLQEILDEKLIERGESKLFFSKISDVLRNYIENRFGLLAPRRTTEESLGDISRDAPFPAEQRELLGGFLQGCDLVKFAEHQPSPEEIVKAVDSCRAFIDATRAPGERPGQGESGSGEARGGKGPERRGGRR